MQHESNQKMTPSAERSAGILTALLTGWGVPGSLARILAGAVIGGLSALWALSQSGCLSEWNQCVDGMPDSRQLMPELPAAGELASK